MRCATTARRRIATAALVLLASAALNILIAWACVLWSPVPATNFHAVFDLDAGPSPGWAHARFRLDTLPPEWTLRRAHAGISRRVHAESASGLGVHHVRLSMREMFRSDIMPVRIFATAADIMIVESGWPFPSIQAIHARADPALLSVPLRDRERPHISDYTDELPPIWRQSIEVPAGVGAATVTPYPGATPVARLPLGVRPAGFTLNTLVWSGLIFAAAAAGSTLRRRIRRLRGHCLACGYNARGLDACPECGSPATISPGREPPPASPPEAP